MTDSRKQVLQKVYFILILMNTDKLFLLPSHVSIKLPLAVSESLSPTCFPKSSYCQYVSYFSCMALQMVCHCCFHLYFFHLVFTHLLIWNRNGGGGAKEGVREGAKYVRFRGQVWKYYFTFVHLHFLARSQLH